MNPRQQFFNHLKQAERQAGKKLTSREAAQELANFKQKQAESIASKQIAKSSSSVISNSAKQAEGVKRSAKTGLGGAQGKAGINLAHEGSAAKVPKDLENVKPSTSFPKEGKIIEEIAYTAPSVKIPNNNPLKKGLVKPLSRGSTGRTEPKNLYEQLAMQEVMSDPLRDAEKLKKITMTDPRWLAEEGWVKMARGVERPDGTKIDIHYVYNKSLDAFDDFKFKDN